MVWKLDKILLTLYQYHVRDGQKKQQLTDLINILNGMHRIQFLLYRVSQKKVPTFENS